MGSAGDTADYRGHVEPGGAPAGRQVGGLGITKQSVGPMDNNVYLLTCLATKERLLIDAANDVDRLPTTGVATVVTTHQHGDHWQALEAYVGKTGARTVAHPLDAPGLPVEPDLLVDHGDTVTVGEVVLSVIHLRGHTPGSIALLYRPESAPPQLFTGDCLFPGGVGNTQKDAARFVQLLDDVSSRVFDVLPDETWVYPGHGDDTTLGAERPHVAEWRERGW
jgi:glyoxylase-like metal-dependent hydrolase (beta-lactamase superfamily II)